MEDQTQKAQRCYDIINGKSGSNSWIQGITGLLGFPFTLAADIAVIPGIYAPLWSEIRAVYGQEPVTSEVAGPVVGGILTEILADIAFDKVMGNVPLIGIYFNAICAKTMTWRLGTLFSMLSARGDAIVTENIDKCMKLIRELFPQSDMFKFTTPDRNVFVQLVCSVADVSPSDYQQKIDNALEAMK